MYDGCQVLENVSKLAAGEPIPASFEGKQFDDWFRRYHGPLTRWLTRKLGDADAAQDIAQNAFLYLMRFAAHTPIANPQALLYKIGGWMALSEIRRRRRERGNCVLIDDAPYACEGAESGCDTPERSAIARQEAKLAFDALASLPSNVMTTFILSRVDGLTYDEIAVSMSVSKSSIEKYMIAALKRLRAVREVALA